MTTHGHFATIELLPTSYDRRNRKLKLAPAEITLNDEQEYAFLHRRGDGFLVALEIAYDSDVAEHEIP